jgi:hypothetical protein
MSIFFSPSACGFFHADIHAEIPADAVAISEARHRELLDGQAGGSSIVAGADGRPRLDRPAKPHLAERRSHAVQLVKAAAADQIERTAPAWRQLNALRGPAGAADPLFSRIDAIRMASDEIEAAVCRMTSAQLESFDPRDPAHWPIPA